MSPHHPHLVGLQETRLPQAEVQPDPDYHIFTTAADAAGVGGCALWLSKHLPYGTSKEGALRFQEHHVTVLSTSPRHLTANILTDRLRLHVQVVHAPSFLSVGATALRHFWAQRASEVHQRPANADFVLLCDSNAKLGKVSSLHVGDHQAEDENQAGQIFHEFLVSVDGYLPSTVATVHRGPGGTWRSPLGHWSRLDFVVTPCHWADFDASSQVLYEVETLQQRDDHVPVWYQCAFSRWAPAKSYVTSRKQVFRPPAACTRSDREAARQSLTTVPAFPWLSNVDVHYRSLVQAWQGVAASATQESGRATPCTFLSDTTQQMIQVRTALRQYLRAEALERRRRWLLIAFAAFVRYHQGTTFEGAAVCTADQWLFDLDVSEARALHYLYISTKAIRRCVADDRLAYLDDLAKQASRYDLRDPAALFKAIRKAFPSAKASRRSVYKPLPSLVLTDGTVAQSFEERCAGWRAHFAAQEAGYSATTEEYVNHFQQYLPKPAWVFDEKAVPSLFQVEATVLTLQRRKAAGADAISAELLKLDVPSTSRQMLPVFVKAALRATEPVTFRGGTLCLLAKRAASALGCDGYRSILVSSVPGKIYHRCIRQQVLPAFLANKAPLHGGIQKGQGIEQVSLAAKTFFALSNSPGQCGALVFFDLKAAFYQVLRQSVVTTTEDDASLLRLFHHLDIPGTALEELRRHLTQVALLEEAGVSSHTRALVSDLFEGTYFRLSQSEELTITKRGSRPGDPAADLLFAFTLSALVRSSLDVLRRTGNLPTMPSPVSRPHYLLQDRQLDLQCPSWADDFFFPQTGSTHQDLLDRVSRAVGVLTSRACAAGMQVKFGTDKTAALLPAGILVHSQHLLEADPDGGHTLSAPLPVDFEPARLPAVHTYRHLGGIVASDCNPTPDLHFRFSQAMGIVRPLRRKLFGALSV